MLFIIFKLKHYFFINRPEELKLGGDQTVAILCSSGTTGLPKGVCISNSSCHFNFGQVMIIIKLIAI